MNNKITPDKLTELKKEKANKVSTQQLILKDNDNRQK